MTGRPTPLAGRVARPRLAALALVGVAVGVAGLLVWLAAADALAALGLRAAIVGYVVALLGLSGYVSVRVFDRREERLD